MEASPTGSHQTVCQIPLLGVYQMPRGSFLCLPAGWPPRSLGSQTRTTSSWVFPTSDVFSHIKGESVVSSAVGSQFRAVKEDGGLPVHGIKMKDDALSLPAGRNAELPSIPEALVTF